MATFRSALRSYNAAVRRAERDSKRREREAASRFKEQQKLEAIEDARNAVEDWEAYVEMIQAMHKDCTAPIDWQEIIDSPEPECPEYCDHHECQAKTNLANFKPSFFDRLLLDKLFSSSIKKRKKLETLLAEAQNKDRSIHNAKVIEFESNKEEWVYLQDMAKGVLEKNIEQYKNAIEFFDPFSSLSFIGGKINISFSKEHIDVDIHIHSDDVIPDYTLSQTSTGKLSKKKMAKGVYNELYQDHVCSSVLRVAREIFNHLPVTHARVNAVSDMLNSKTGFLEEQSVVSALIPRQTLERINLDSIDPSDSMSNFKHNMQFKKTDGFKPVEKVDIPV